MRLNKKGISPLIATVLLIGFTIVLAALVFKWGGQLFEQITDQTGTEAKAKLDIASKVSIKINSMTYDSALHKITRLIVNNEGFEYTIDYFQVQREWDDGSIETVQVNYELAPGQGADITNNGANTIDFSTKTGNFKSFKVIPVVTIISGKGNSIQIQVTEQLQSILSGDSRISNPSPLPPTCQTGTIDCNVITDETFCGTVGCIWNCDLWEPGPPSTCVGYWSCFGTATITCAQLINQGDCTSAGCSWN